MRVHIEKLHGAIGVGKRDEGGVGAQRQPGDCGRGGGVQLMSGGLGEDGDATSGPRGRGGDRKRARVGSKGGDGVVKQVAGLHDAQRVIVDGERVVRQRQKEGRGRHAGRSGLRPGPRRRGGTARGAAAVRGGTALLARARARRGEGGKGAILLARLRRRGAL
ncbi:rRNA 2'-O-methyltransferase fibrillarin [Gracilaria domingensis]|nr:rRNA 2'-O-methyltransferase fibrillarin [Gracilaria domingensis]